MRRIVIATAALVLALTLYPPSPLSASASVTTKRDQDAIQGSWALVDQSFDGRAMPAEEVRASRMTFTFSGDRAAGAIGEHESAATFRLDETRSPREIRMTATDGDQKGRTVWGIYRLSGDDLVLAFPDHPGQAPPADMKAAPGWTVMRFNRSK